MVKLILPLIIGLLLGVSGGGFWSVMQASKLHATAIADAKKYGIKPAGDSTHAAGDSASVGDSTSHDTQADTGDASHADGAHAATTHAAPTPTPPGPAPAASPPATSAANGAVTAAETQAHQRRLAKIFSTMGAKDAARVLAQMTDHDVSIILGLLADRQAAAILTNLPAPRAAALSAVQPRRGGTE
jgi:hypothetical protein